MAIITADGRDITKEEWRVIPGFKRYKITSDGDVLNRRRHKLLVESNKPGTEQYYYSLTTDSGGSTSRTWQSLVDLAFPELKAPPKVKVEKYIKRGEWRDIPGFPKHQAHADGAVRYKISRRRVAFTISSLDNCKYVKLQGEAGVEKATIGYFVKLTFPELFQEEEELAA